jgi:DNA-binding XRE family transcriptional regulator
VTLDVRRTVGVRVNPDLVLRSMAERGMTRSDLAKAADLSPGTMTNMLAGKPISQRSFRKLAVALERAEAVGARWLADGAA